MDDALQLLYRMERLLFKEANLVIKGEFKVVPLSASSTPVEGKPAYAFVSPEDYEMVMKVKWSASLHSRPGMRPKWYARGRLEGKLVFMHRFLMAPPADMVVDHHDANGVNNTRGNLRVMAKGLNTALGNKGRAENCEPWL